MTPLRQENRYCSNCLATRPFIVVLDSNCMVCECCTKRLEILMPDELVAWQAEHPPLGDLPRPPKLPEPEESGRMIKLRLDSTPLPPPPAKQAPQVPQPATAQNNGPSGAKGGASSPSGGQPGQGKLILPGQPGFNAANQPRKRRP